ncbi:MAG: hypothetical protein U0168_07445 [Nannocystaceae bacterium]
MFTRILHTLAPFVLVLAASDAHAGPAQRQVRSSDVSMTLEGGPVGVVDDLDFPFASSQVVVEPSGPGAYGAKHLSTLHYDDVRFSVGARPPKALLEWIRGTLQMNDARKNGGFTTGEVQHEFFNALLTEIGFPALDAGSKNAASLTLAATPEYARTQRAASKAKVNDAPMPLSTRVFTLTIDGIATAKVVKIDAFTIKQVLQQDAIGDARDYLVEPAKLEFPDLSIYMRPEDSDDFMAWHQDFVVQGNCGSDREKAGRLDLFDASGKPALSLQLFNVGIFRVDDVGVGSERLRRIDSTSSAWTSASPGRCSRARPRPWQAGARPRAARSVRASSASAGRCRANPRSARWPKQ